MVRDDLLQVIAVAVDSNDRREVLHFEFPYGFWTAELLEPDAQHALNALRIDLRSTSDAVEVDSALLLARLLSLWPHAAFPDDGLHAETLDDVGLVGFFTNRCRWACSDDAVSI